jgi:hypothetical protein
MRTVTLKSLLLCCLLFLSASDCAWPGPTHKTRPIYNGQDGISDPPLVLGNSYSYVRSGAFTYKNEYWFTRDPKSANNRQLSRMVTIERYILPSQQAAIDFPFTHRVVGQLRWPGWSNTTDIGDKTLWYTPTRLFFVQGRVFVKVTVTATELIGRPYTEGIGRFLRARLSEQQDDDSDDTEDDNKS